MSAVRAVSGVARLRRAATVASVLALLGAGFVATPSQASPASFPSVTATEASPTSNLAQVLPEPALRSGAQVRGDLVFRRGVPVRDVTVSKNGRRVSATVYWNQEMIARKGNRDRFNVRLVAFGSGGAASPIVLKNRSTTKRLPVVQKITLKLSKKKANQLRASSDVVLAVSQQYGRNGKPRNKYFRQYVTVTDAKHESKARAKGSLGVRSSTAPTPRAVRDCSRIEIKTGTDLHNCFLSRANLSGSDLSRVNLSGAILSGAVLTACNLNNVELAGADLTGVVSGGITGTPASLPDGWALTNGTLAPATPGPTPDPTPPAQVPDAPVAPTSSALGDGTVTLDWVAPADRGSAVTGYNVQVDDGSGSNYADATGCTALGTVLTCTATGLTNGTGYSFKVRASNSVGDSAYSGAGGPFTPAVQCSTFSVGDPGPGGGKIFYKDLGRAAGSQCFEAAPANWDDVNDPDPSLVWGSGSCSTLDIPAAAGQAIGDGENNTTTITEATGCDDPAKAPAAWAAKSYAGGMLTDWFLPSIDELDELDLSGVGGLERNLYWSSSQNSADTAWFQYVGEGGGVNNRDSDVKTALYLVRPVRSF